MMKHQDQSNLGKSGFIWGVHHFIIEESQGRNLEAGSDAEAMEEYCLQACSSWLAQPSSYRTKDHQPRDGTTHRGLGPPIFIINKKMCTHLRRGQSDRGCFSVEAPSSQMTLACVKLTKSQTTFLFYTKEQCLRKYSKLKTYIWQYLLYNYLEGLRNLKPLYRFTMK